MKAAIFDMDGTLLDSMSMWFNLAPSFAGNHGIAWTQSLADTIKDMAFAQAADYFVLGYPQLDMTPTQLITVWHEMIRLGYQNDVLPKPYALEYLRLLEQLNIPCAVATMTDHALADMVLERHGISALVQCVLTPEDVGGVGKDRPDIFLEAARRLKTPVSQCVVFEDTLFAIETAAAAGFTVWAIEEPLQPFRNKIVEACHRYINGYSELLL